MPKGTAVDNVYQALKRQGMSVQSAVRIAQSRTGEALATGKPPKNPRRGSYRSGPANAMALGRDRA